jgi:hypothetical protein
VNWKIRCCPEVETVINELLTEKKILFSYGNTAFISDSEDSVFSINIFDDNINFIYEVSLFFKDKILSDISHCLKKELVNDDLFIIRDIISQYSMVIKLNIDFSSFIFTERDLTSFALQSLIDDTEVLPFNISKEFINFFEGINGFNTVFNTFDNILENNAKVKLIVPDIIINRTKKYKLKTNI